MREKNQTQESLTRRTLARTLGGAAAAACLSSLPATAKPPAAVVADSALDAAIASAFATTPAALSPEQRLDVRNGVRSVQQALAQARGARLGYETEPATIFLAKPAPE